MRAMRFECDSCHAKYKISDEKVQGRVVRFPCRKCDHKIMIDGRANDPDVTVRAAPAYKVEKASQRHSETTRSFAHEAPTARARRQSSPSRRRPSSIPPRRPSASSRRLSSPAAASSAVASSAAASPAAASSALVGNHPGLAPPVPVAPAGPPIAVASDVPQWHVSINDVPVGPVRLEELGHKIDAGAVSEYSLVWREGFDEWRPLATVPELMAVLHERRHSGPPPRTSFSSMPPFVDSRTSSTSESVQTVIAEAPAAQFTRSEAPDDFVPLADSLQPEGALPGDLRDMSQPPSPIGPPAVFGSSPQLGSFSGLPAAPDAEVSVPSSPPAAAAASSEPRRGISLGILALIFALIVLAGVVAFLTYERFGDSVLNDWLGKAEPAEQAAPVPVPAAPVVPTATPEADVEATAAVDAAGEDEATIEAEAAEAETQEPSVDEKPASAATAKTAGEASSATEPELIVQPPDPANDPPKMAPAPAPKPRARRRARPAPVVEEASSEGALSAEEQKILDEFGSSADAAPAKIDVKKAGSTQSGKPPLDGDGVRATVTTNKPRLQRCYERAIRGQQSPPSVRLDVSVTVAASGRVKEVSADGNGPGGLAACIEASVRRWRFPASSEGGPAKFPIVFSAN